MDIKICTSKSVQLMGCIFFYMLFYMRRLFLNTGRFIFPKAAGYTDRDYGRFTGTVRYAAFSPLSCARLFSLSDVHFVN